ncbi:MAG: biotin--[acetyl-CoA-carboxylase] ligase [Gammaproteobacteria bacterium]
MSGADPARLDALADRLLRARGAVPVEALKLQLACSEEQLVAWADELRDLGAPLVETADGYVLELDDALDAAAIRAALRARAAVTVKVCRVCASTGVEVRKLTPPALCVAEAQTAGRGRRGTEWRQTFGAGLALSLAAPAPRGRLDPLAIALAVAAAGCLDAAGYAGIQIKWPNDLYVRGAKLGGLMVEMEGAGRGPLCLGLGLNVHAAPTLSGRRTVALAELGGPPPGRNRLTAMLAAVLMDALQRYGRDGFTVFAAEFAARDWLANRRVALRDDGESIEGVARGIDGFGALVLDSGEGRRLCRVGEVTRVAPMETTWAGA